tara:strand:- start:9511 stop:9777 length:267 start_codon:yes stop_codon:yes gene_type:complete
MRVGDLVKHRRKRWRYNRMNPWKPAIGVVVGGPTHVEYSKAAGITHVRKMWEVRWACFGKRSHMQIIKKDMDENRLILLSSIGEEANE